MPGFFYVYRIYIKYIYSPFFARFAADHGRAIVLFVTRRAYPDLKHISEDNLIPKDNDYQSTVIIYIPTATSRIFFESVDVAKSTTNMQKLQKIKN